MPPHSKKPKLIGRSANAEAEVAAGNADAADPNSTLAQPIFNADNCIDDIPDLVLDESNMNDPTINGISNSLIASVLGFLSYRDIMTSRICCRKFRDAAKTTIVAWSEGAYKQQRETKLQITSVQTYKAMVAMAQALPKLQRLDIFDIGRKHKYRDGLDPEEEEATRTASQAVHDIQMISSFRQLRWLKISYTANLNGRYPFLFTFPLLEKLEISGRYIKWDLSMLAGVPLLKELYTGYDSREYPTGNIKSLRVLKDTLEKVTLWSSKIEGDLMDLADFPHLKLLDLRCPEVTGDLRLIKVDDFPKLRNLYLEKKENIIGTNGHEFQHISDVPSAMEAIHRLSQRETTFISNIFGDYCLSLSKDSTEWYDNNGKIGHPYPPFSLTFVRVGTRVGWRWMTKNGYRNATNSCEVNWLDPEPGRESSEYADYVRELESIQEEIFCFEGYHEPPSEEEYKRLCDEYYDI